MLKTMDAKLDMYIHGCFSSARCMFVVLLLRLVEVIWSNV